MSLVLFSLCDSLLFKFVYNMLVARKAIHKLVCLNKIVTLLIRGLQYVKVTHFLFCCFRVDVVLLCCALSVNLLKPTGYVMHQQFNIQQLYALPTLYLCVLYLSENKRRLVPLTA